MLRPITISWYGQSLFPHVVETWNLYELSQDAGATQFMAVWVEDMEKQVFRNYFINPVLNLLF